MCIWPTQSYNFTHILFLKIPFVSDLPFLCFLDPFEGLNHKPLSRSFCISSLQWCLPPKRVSTHPILVYEFLPIGRIFLILPFRTSPMFDCGVICINIPHWPLPDPGLRIFFSISWLWENSPEVMFELMEKWKVQQKFWTKCLCY